MNSTEYRCTPNTSRVRAAISFTSVWRCDPVLMLITPVDGWCRFTVHTRSHRKSRYRFTRRRGSGANVLLATWVHRRSVDPSSALDLAPKQVAQRRQRGGNREWKRRYYCVHTAWACCNNGNSHSKHCSTDESKVTASLVRFSCLDNSCGECNLCGTSVGESHSCAVTADRHLLPDPGACSIV